MPSNLDTIWLNVYNISEFRNNINNNERQCMLSLVSVNRQEKVNAKSRQSVKDNCLISGYLLEKTVKDYIKENKAIELDRLDIALTKEGKPYLNTPDITDIEFNMSNSGDYVAVAVADKLVGIDIEECGRCDLKIANRFFSKSEISFINGLSDDYIKSFFSKCSQIAKPGMDELLTLYWTFKEAYLKFKGDGISRGLSSFDVDIKNLNVTGDESGKYYWDFTKDANYAYSLYADYKNIKRREEDFIFKETR
ncbi:MAG: 4'-phosphopantetheinyl transferase superfamily protein [Lachnospiraceae bacterium]|nr:4'-phosphopantetheinyl transferase superfamily protein [Lachnospiraceae bacterium]